MRQLRVWLWAGVVTTGVSAALLGGAAVASAGTESDPGPSHVASQSIGGDATSADSGTDANRPHGILRHTILSGHRSTPTANTIAQRSDAGNDAQVTSTHRPFGFLRDNLSTALRSASTKDVVARADSATLSIAVVPPPVEKVSAVTKAAAVPIAQPAKTVGSVIGGIVSKVGTFAFNAVQAVETVVTGPPVVPPNSTVTVHSSTIELSNGQAVPANWYFPETDDGAPPENMILLQHGFFAQGPMYSYTAATLAEQTHSVVVTPTLSSNPFAGDNYWLGGTGMAESIGDLFLGDRAALTASAMDAGYASAYPGATQLPQKFALEGHSLGANVVSGAAGYIADNCTPESCAADDLVGVILLDGVPSGDTLPDALAKLDKYAGNLDDPEAHYIPVRQIGAPFNLFNSISTVNEDLTAARPDRFNGVILDGGVHMDSMRGGNPLIQLAAYAVAGVPQPQNPPAVDQLSASWLNEWFLTGDTGVDDGLEPGSTVDIDTPQGTAHGVVIGASQPNVLAAALQAVLPLFLSLAA